MKKTGKVLAVMLGVLFPLCGCGRESRGLTVYVVRSEALYRNGWRAKWPPEESGESWPDGGGNS